ncbi:MAG: FAD-binding oxidoreductase [Pseudomonadota bacterium]
MSITISTITPPTTALLERLKDALGPSGWRDPVEHPAYLEEPRGKWSGRAALVLRPETTAQVAEIVRLAAEARVGLVPYGGGTGLVGGQLSVAGPPPLLLSLERMNRIRSVSAEDDVMIVEAGCVLQSVQETAAEAGRLFPLSYAAQGSARIGGALAVNSGGVQVLRYGNARDLCLGIEAVLPDGSVMHGLKGLRKDNTGYDLRHLLIGSEGTLGIITAAALKLFPQPAETATAMATLDSAEGAVRLLRDLQAAAGDTVTAFELMNAQGLEFTFERIEGLRDPFPEPRPRAPWTVLVELSGRGVGEALIEALGAAFEAGLVLDATVAESEAQRQQLWRIREDMPLANRAIGAIASHDISIPIRLIPGFIEEALAALGDLDPSIRTNCFGHLGDGNLHFNQFPAEGRDRRDYRDKAEAVSALVHDLTHAAGGSISAEHGIGRLKVAELARFGDPAKLAAMRAIKGALDPLGIMNPGAIFAVEDGEAAF